jgi:hypothetical protein
VGVVGSPYGALCSHSGYVGFGSLHDWVADVDKIRKEVSDMDEYIKREDALDAVLFALVGTGYQSRAIYAIRDVPTADVAPRAEVVNKICCKIEEEIVAALESNYRALKEWDDGRCNDYILEMVNRIKGKIDALREIEGFVEELKKKYTVATDTNVGNK